MNMWRRAQLRLPAARHLNEQNARLREDLRVVRGRLRSTRRRLQEVRTQRDKLRSKNAKKRGRIKELHAQLARLRRRDDYGYVWIVTYGRSGSTLLQGVLNSIPGYLIRGENGQVLRNLYEFHREASAQRTRRRRWMNHNEGYDELPVTHPFYGIDKYPQSTIRLDVRRLFVDNVLGPEPDTRVIGFKEVRWLDEDTPEFVAWIDFFFPGSRFVINTRAIDDVARSGWWGEREGSRDELARVDAMLRQLVTELGDAAYHVHYDDYCDNPEALAGLFDWLGEEFDAERVRQVMAVRHSFDLPKKDPDVN